MKKFVKPKPGVTVTVTTRFKDYYIFSDQEYKDSTYTGRVLTDERWFNPNQFQIATDGDRPPVRVIDLDYVIDLQIGGKQAAQKEAGESRTVIVKGSKGNDYVVTVHNGTPRECTCTGFKFRRQCRHLKEAVDLSPEMSDNPTTGEKPTVSVHHRRSTDMARLTWNDRLALMNHFQPSDARACKAFNVTQDELDTARSMAAAGTFAPTEDIDYAAYNEMFDDGDGDGGTPKPATVTSTVAPVRPTTVTSTIKPIAVPIAPAATATKKVITPKKRGRKGNKIALAFDAIPSSPVPAEQFASDHNVSLAVLRQSKRFDKTPEKGKVHVKMNGNPKQLMIWRDQPLP